MSWTVKTAKDNVVELAFSVKSREPLRISFSSDHHIDSTHCRRDMIAESMEAACSNGAPIVMIGDFFDVMGCQRDPRSSKKGLRPEYLHGGRDYLDAVVEDAANFLAPFAKNIALVCRGNHETAIQKNAETCVTSRLVERLRVLGSPARAGGYAGWLWVKCTRSKYAGTSTYRVFWHHGSGGAGGSTRGIGEFARIGDYIEGADAIVCGHVHQRGIYETRRQRLTSAGVVVTRSVHHVRCGCWKDDFHGEGWAVEKGIGPRPMGGWVLELRQTRERDALAASWYDTF